MGTAHTYPLQSSLVYMALFLKMATDYHHKDLPDYIQHVLAQSVGSTGRRIVDRPVLGLEADVSLKYANALAPYHKLVYKPGFEQHRGHLLLESATKIKRMMAAPIESRLVPEPTGALPFYMSINQTAQTIGSSPSIPIEQQLMLLYESITQIPTDLRVYRDILDAHPQHTDALWEYAQDHGPCPVFIDTCNETLIPALVESITSIYAAYALEMNELLDERKYPIPESHTEIGQTLTDRLYVGAPQGHQGDIVATESWAYSLGLDAIYRWKTIS